MKKICSALSFILLMVHFTSDAFAGTPQTTLECKSDSGNAHISGVPEGEGFDLKIQIDKAVIRYRNTCDGVECPATANYGALSVVDALYDQVFTIYFENSEQNNRGIFYALPDTVNYKKNSRGYTASYKGVYLGDDPRSTEPFKEFVKAPGVIFTCTQENKL